SSKRHTRRDTRRSTSIRCSWPATPGPGSASTFPTTAIGMRVAMTSRPAPCCPRCSLRGCGNESCRAGWGIARLCCTIAIKSRGRSPQGEDVAAVELRNLTKRYGTLAVVDDISLTIEHGRLVCLLGPSGCGKTTTLRLIAGFAEPSAGEIRVGDRVVSSPSRTIPPERRNMSMIFQSYALWPHMTVAQNESYGLELRKVDGDRIKRKLAAIVQTTHLEQLAERYPGELSGGQQQRVALARALVVEPETLLLDEPLSNLDANLREEMRFEVRRLHDEYRYTTVYVTHDQS